MICGAVSTVTEYLTWFRRLRSLPALTSSLRMTGLYSTTAVMTAESPLCGERGDSAVSIVELRGNGNWTKQNVGVVGLTTPLYQEHITVA